MLEEKINFWDIPIDDKTVFCITTNGVINYSEELIMGKGIALEAKNRYPELPKIFGKYVRHYGNIVGFVKMEDGRILATFPTKNHWKDKADIDLIIKSAKYIQERLTNFNKVYLPRPGCGNGGLDWEKEVKPVIKDILSDKVIIVSN